MYQKYTININADNIRENIYCMFRNYLDSEFSFVHNNDYLWFKRYIIQKNEDNVIIDYSDSRIEFEWGTIIRICIVGINKKFSSTFTKEIELSGKFNKALPKFEKGKD